MTAALPKLAYWLLPAEAAAEFFRETIRRLARSYDAPEFEPHLTLCGGPALDEREVQQKLSAFAEEFAPVELHVGAVAQSEKFAKTVFVEFESHPILEEMVRRLGGGEIQPHVSVIYKELRPEQRARTIDSVRLPFQSAVFDRVVAYRIPQSIASRADVEAWRAAVAPVKL